MAEITAATVKELRERTGAGMMDCKKALAEANGDMEAAIDWLRAKGLAAAAKKAGRTAAEGLVGVDARFVLPGQRGARHLDAGADGRRRLGFRGSLDGGSMECACVAPRGGRVVSHGRCAIQTVGIRLGCGRGWA